MNRVLCRAGRAGRDELSPKGWGALVSARPLLCSQHKPEWGEHHQGTDPGRKKKIKKKMFNSSVRSFLQPVLLSDSRSTCTAQHAQNSTSGWMGWQQREGGREGGEEGKRTAFLRSTNSLNTLKMLI